MLIDLDAEVEKAETERTARRRVKSKLFATLIIIFAVYTLIILTAYLVH